MKGQQKLPQLVKGQSSYKLIVPEKVEEKIRYLLRKFPHTEWSGVLFISHTGTFENNDLVITCQDIFPMDLGTTGWTEFQMSEDVAAYMAQNIELFDCDTALIHSHHTMGAFLSGQDIKMVQQEGNDTNCFVSLVVDTKGTYVAIVTRKVQTKSEVTVKHIGTSYEFFGEGSKEITHDGTEVTKVIDKEIIEYFDLEVERHEVTNSLGYLDERFAEIEQKKKAAQSWEPHDIIETQTHEDKNFMDWLHGTKVDHPKAYQQPLPFSDITPEDNAKLDELALEWIPDSKKIHAAVVHMITCSLILNPDKFDLKQWIHKHMVNVYERLFGAKVTSIPNADAFSEWKDYIIQYTLDYFDYDDAPDTLLDDYDLLVSRIAKAIWEELTLYATANPYIEEYQKALENYILE